jgi:hypothetical protein
MHKFNLGDIVTYTAEAGFYRERGTYEIAAHLPPNEDGEVQYRIRKVGDGGERVAREFQLTRGPAENEELAGARNPKRRR